MFKRLCELDGIQLGDLVNDCTGFNSPVLKAKPIYKRTKRGKVLIDLDLTTVETTCSFYHCDVEPPLSAFKIRERCDIDLEAWKNDDFDFFKELYNKYKNVKINPDGTKAV